MRPFSVFALGGILLVSLEEEIDDSGIELLQKTVSTMVSRQNARGVIVDLHDIELLDSYLARHLQKLALTLKLLNARLIVVGLSVPVVMTLLDFDITLQDMDFALDVEQALARLQQHTE